MSASRLEKLQQGLRKSGLDALALNPGASLTYLTGLQFHLMERPVVLLLAADAAPVIVLPELELLKLADLSYELKAFSYGEDPAGWQAVFRQAVSSLGVDRGRIGVEPRALRLLEYSLIHTAAPEAEYPDATDAVGELRLHKEPGEVAAMRKAVAAAELALQATLPQIKIGRTELEIAEELTAQLLHNGSQPELPFAPVVSGGPNSANPHATPSRRPLQTGDLLVVDWGATVDGYISDLTRTFPVGEVDPLLVKIHRVVQEANAAGRGAAKPGAPCAAVDQAARSVIERAGYGANFTHRTGHGIGLEAHEEPYLRSDNQSRMEPGMTFTVEPGIYLPGRAGVRIEDDVIITDQGADCLSSIERGWKIVG
jgi:Xaa-Pro dipeptidase